MEIQTFLSEHGHRFNNRSAIEQELIDGRFYWDNIGRNWYRLIERATHDVVGHVKQEVSGFAGHIRHSEIVTLLKRPTPESNTLTLRSYTVSENGKAQVEQYCKDAWLGAKE